MSGIFEELEMFDEGDKVVTRQAIAAATKRLNDNFGGFLRQASTKKEFESRLALVDTDINNMVADVVTEYGGDAEKITSAVKETVKTAFTPTTPSNHDFPPCENCGGHGCKDCTNDPDGSNYDGPSSKDAEAEMPDNLYKGASDRPERLKAQDEIQLAEEHSQVNPWLKKQIQDEDQEDGGNLRNKEANEHGKNVEFPDLTHGYGQNIPPTQLPSPQIPVSDVATPPNQITQTWNPDEHGKNVELIHDTRTPLQPTANLEDSQPVANPVPFAETEGTGGNIEKKLESAPSAIGIGNSKEAAPVLPLGWNKEDEDNLGVHPLDNPRGASSSAHTVEKKGDEFVVVEDGGEEAAGPFDSQEEAYARANELNDLENLEKDGTTASIKQAAPNEAEQEAAARNTLYPESGDVKVSPAPKKPTTCPSCNGEGLIRNNTPISEQHQAMLDEIGWDTEDESGVPIYRYYYDPCPNCADERGWEGSGQVTATMKKALALKEAAARGEKRNFFSKDEWVNEGDTVTKDGEEKKVEDIAQHGDEKVVELNDGSVADIDDVEVAGSKTAAKPETGDKTEENESLPTGNEDAHDGPSPKIDKTKWKPNATNPDGNLKPIDTEGENSPHPTRQMDIKQKPDYQQDTLENLKKYDNNVWEREELPTATEDEAGFEGTRNIEQLPTKTFPDKGQTNPVTDVSLPQALAEKTALFEDERDILEENVPEDYAPSREGVMSELADLKQRLIDGGSSPEEAEGEIKDLVMGMWRTEQSPEELGEIGIEDTRSKFDKPVVEEEIEEIIERGDDEDDRVEVIHDHEEDEDKDPLGFDDPNELDEDEDEDIPFDEELSEEELDKLLKEEEEYDDEDLFL